MKSLILYKTKWGSTHEYAEYLHTQAPESDIFSMDEFSTEDFNNYQIVVIGSRVFMGNIEAVSYLVQNWDILKTKKVFLFAVGLIDPDTKESIDSYNKIPEEIRNNIKFQKVAGKVTRDKLNPIEKMLLSMVKADTEKKGKEFSMDKMDLETLKPVIDFINQD